MSIRSSAAYSRLSSMRPPTAFPQAQDFHAVQAGRLRAYYGSIPILNRRAAVLFRWALVRLRGVFVFNKELRTIIQIGTGSGLVDSADRYKNNLEQVVEETRKKLRSLLHGKPHELGWVLHPDNTWLHAWNLVILCLLLYSFIVVPYLIAFVDVNLHSPWFVVDVCVDFLFFIDILVSCNTAFYESSGKLVSSRKEIFKTYLRGMLIIDCLSTFPLYLITMNTSGGSGSKSNSLIRFLRISKLSKLCKASKMGKVLRLLTSSKSLSKCLELLKKYDSVTRLLGTLNTVMIMAHFTACMWFFTAKLDEFGPNTWVVRLNYQNEDTFSLYLISLYWAITTLTTVGFGDITAVTPMEMAIAMLWMLFGVGFYSFIMGTLSSMITGIDANTAFLDERLQLVDLFSKDTGLPPKSVKRISSEVKSTTEGITLTESQRETVLKDLSRTLKFDVVRHMHDSASEKIEILAGVNLVCLGKILPKMRRKTVNMHEAVYTEGDMPEHVFFLMKGRVRFIISKRNLVFKTVVEGSFFGEAEVLEARLREFTTETETDVDLLCLKKELFLEQLSLFPDISAKVYAAYNLRKLRDKERMSELLDLLEAVEIRKETTFQDLAGRARITYSEPEASESNAEVRVEERLKMETQSMWETVAVWDMQEVREIAESLTAAEESLRSTR